MPGRISCPTLVGREGEFKRVTSLLKDASGSHPLILIGGEAGIGKTRLLEAVLADARERGALVFAGSCIPFAGRTLPYGPILDALRPRHDEDRSPGLVSLRRDLRAALAVSDGRATFEAGKPSGQAHLFESIIEALERASERADVILSIEDLHWSDAATRDLLAFMVLSRWSSRASLVATLRTDESTIPVQPLLTEFERARQLERIDLAPLGEDGVRDIAAGIVGEQLAPKLVEAISRRSGGNPFFVEELVATARGGDATIPPNLGEILLARVASLPDNVQRTLRYMAVIGDRTPVALLAAVAKAGPAVLERRLRPAKEMHVVRADGTGSYAFRHALMREALYADLPPHERRAMHERVARTLAAPAGERLLPPAARTLALALHWDEADRAEALPALVEAAAVATSSYAYADAVQLYRRCLLRWEQHPRAAASVGVDLATLHERGAEAAHLADDTEAAIDLVRRAIALTDAAAEPARAGLLHQRLGEYLWQHGYEAESLEMTSRAFDLVPADGSATRAMVVSAWGRALTLVSRYGDALEVVGEAVRIGRSIGHPDATSMSLAVRGLAHSHLDGLAAGMRDLREALDLARGSTDPEVQAFAYLDASWTVGIIHRDPRTALEIIADWEELQRQAGLEHSRGMWLAGVAGGMNMRLGRWQEADAIMTAALRQPSRGPVRLELLENIGLLRVWQGRPDEAGELVSELLALVRTMIGQPMIGSNYAVAIEHDVWRGDPAAGVALLGEAREHLLAPDDPVQTRHLYAVGLRACADQVEQLRTRRTSGSDVVGLRQMAGEISRLARYPGLPNLTASQPETEAWAAQGEAELLRIEASSSEAEAWRTVAESWSALERAELEAYARWREASASLASGDRTAAATALEAGRARAVSVGAGAVGSSLEHLAARARLRLATVSDGHAAERARRWGLTAREAEVLALVVRGMTNRQIAGELFITEKTASVHVSNILAKLDVRSRAHAAAIAVQDGLLSA